MAETLNSRAMKNFTFITFLLFSFHIATSQSCLPEGITFSTQSQIDSFLINYPGCTEIGGDVYIGAWLGGDINNLNGLNVLTSIGGGLAIGYWFIGTSLKNLAGLDNLTYIGGDLDIHANPVLQSLTGLENLTFIGGNIAIGNNLAKSTDSEDRSHGNPCLKNLTGLENLEAIGGGIFMQFNDSLSSVNGLGKLDSIEGIITSDPIVSLSDLSNLTYIGVYGLGLSSTGLTNLNGLENVTSILGDLIIESNDYMISLDGLENIDTGTIENLSIINNFLLSSCDVKSICDYLSSPGGAVEIHDNAQGCNSQQEVEEKCESASIYEEPPFLGLSLFPNPAHQKLNISSAELNIDEVVVYALTGQQVFAIRPKSETIDISSLPRGMYIVEARVENRKVRQKLVIE
jgi:hypothetical protein